MTNEDAVKGAIEPYALSDDAVEKFYIDAQGAYGGGDFTDSYSVDNLQTVNYAAILCLNNCRTLSSENAGGVSQSYDTQRIAKMIRALAAAAGLDISDDLLDDDSPTIMFT